MHTPAPPAAQDPAALLAAIHAALPALTELRERIAQNHVPEDIVYRLYHHSFKVFHLARHTEEILAALEGVCSNPLNEEFLAIVSPGIGVEFALSMNDDWFTHARPVVEAFLHARHMLDLLVGYGRLLEHPPQVLPVGWATVLHLYNLR